MKIIITAGGTSEKIDSVRKITNTATGRLGYLIANEFLRYTEAEIIFVCGTGAIMPDGCQILKTESVYDLKEALTKLLSQSKIDAVIHSMAVSDYTVKNAVPAEQLLSEIKAQMEKNRTKGYDDCIGLLNAVTFQSAANPKNKKISSDSENLVILMEKAPKVISLIKQLQPKTVLAGFKLLSGADEQTLLNAGYKLLQKNNCDFVLANDLEKISGDRHEGVLIKEDMSFQRLYSKPEIAKAITKNVLNKIKTAVC